MDCVRIEAWCKWAVAVCSLGLWAWETGKDSVLVTCAGKTCQNILGEELGE